MFWLVQLLTPIAIVVVLPVMIVWLINRTLINRDNKNAEIIIKTLENNSNVDADKLIEALGKSEEQILYLRLLRGCIFSIIGIVFAIITIIWACQDPDIEEYLWTLSVSGLSFAIGIAYLIVYFVSRKQKKNEIE